MQARSRFLLAFYWKPMRICGAHNPILAGCRSGLAGEPVQREQAEMLQETAESLRQKAAALGGDSRLEAPPGP